MPTPIARDIAHVNAIGSTPAILELMLSITGLSFACIARVTDRAWVACAVLDRIGFGLEAGFEMEVSQTICNEVRVSGKLVTIDHASTDPVYRHHPSLRENGFESYVSLPIYRVNGEFFGTICAVDKEASAVSAPALVEQLRLLAHMLSLQLGGANPRAAKALDADQAATLYAQYAALLGQEVRAPVNAVARSLDNALRQPVPAALRPLLEEARRGTFQLSRRLDNVLDFTRARLGGGLLLSVAVANALATDFAHVIDNMRRDFPGRTISAELDVASVVCCDRVRIAQLLAILLTNALQHGAPDGPVSLHARSDRHGLVLAVKNAGPAMSADTVAALFRPYVRDERQAAGAGLGLGLFLASQIAQAHKATLALVAQDGTNVFTFSMPLLKPAQLAGSTVARVSR